MKLLKLQAFENIVCVKLISLHNTFLHISNAFFIFLYVKMNLPSTVYNEIRAVS
jgi:hypothetical protein